jgi:hypothetical protein
LSLDPYRALSPAYCDNALHIRALEPPTIELMLFVLLLLASLPPISLSHKPRNFAAIMVQLKDQFLSIDTAHKAIEAYVLDQGESYKLVASDKRRYIISCKDNSCKFRIRATRSAKEAVFTMIFVPHSCSPETHYPLPHYDGAF